jgi:Tfp pilus assembly protein PilW
MMSASVEIILLLLAAGLIGSIVGLGVGQLVGGAERRRRTLDNLRSRLTETQRAVLTLERTAAAGSAQREPDTGVRLADRVAAARETDSSAAPEPAKHP